MTDEQLIPSNDIKKSKTPWMGILLLLLFSNILLWSATGTLVPYALTHSSSRVCGECNYLCNLDHPHFEMTFSFLKGTPREDWIGSVYLRRILYPLIAYPAMTMFGYLTGGLLTSFIIWNFVFIIFSKFIFNRYGTRAALVASALLATYPGHAYWFGLPYAHSVLVPSVLCVFMLMMIIGERPKLFKGLIPAFLMGIVFLAYDLLPFFAAATMLMLLWQRRYLHIPVIALFLIIPSFISTMILYYSYDIPFTNSNSESFTAIIMSYFNAEGWKTWWPIAMNVHKVFWHNYRYSNFIFLPYAFLLFILIGYISKKQFLNIYEGALLTAIFLVFLFNNLAPEYKGWQMRGEWIARIYQPTFVIMIVYLSRFANLVKAGSKRWFVATIVCLMLLNALTITAPFLGLRWSDSIYYNFYRHSSEDAIKQNIATYGARPFGFCGNK